MPDAPWIMTQTWNDLLFAHWPVDRRLLQEQVPAGLSLDLFEGQAWIGIVPFRITNLAPRGVPSIPFVSAFAELNVRTYVTLEHKPGVYFFSLDAASALAVAGARALFHLPYFTASMTVNVAGETVHYTSSRTTKVPSARFEASYRPIGPVQPPAPGTLEHFLTERYCLYTVAFGRVWRGDIHHGRWPIQQVEAEIPRETVSAAAGLHLSGPPVLTHFSAVQEVLIWTLEQA